MNLLSIEREKLNSIKVFLCFVLGLHDLAANGQTRKYDIVIYGGNFRWSCGCAAK